MKKDENVTYCDEGLCDNMTIEQLEKLKGTTQGSTDPSIVGSLFKKQFSYELSEENQQIWTNEEKYANLMVLQQAITSNGLPKSL